MDWPSGRSEEIALRLSQLYTLAPFRVKQNSIFREIINDPDVSKSVLLASLPTTRTRSYRPLHVLYLLLTEIPGPWPPFELLYHYTRIQQSLPESPQANHQDDATWLVQRTEAIVKESYESLAFFIAQNDEVALCPAGDEDDDTCITYNELSDFVKNFSLPLESQDRRTAVAIVLPNSPLLAAVCLAVANYYTAVPIDPDEDLENLRDDLERVEARHIITTSSVREKLPNIQVWIEHEGIQIFEVAREEDHRITLRDAQGQSLVGSPLGQPRANRADDVAVMLFTTGIWGEKGLVTLTLHSLLREAFQMAESCKLTPPDMCLSMTPIFDVGGLTRGLVASAITAGAFVCCLRRDTTVFWDIIDNAGPTWYLASLATHKLLLAEHPFHSDTEPHTLRLACRSDGFIPSDLAQLIRDTFGCEVATTLANLEYAFNESEPAETSTSQWRTVRFSDASTSNSSPRGRRPQMRLVTNFPDNRQSSKDPPSALKHGGRRSSPTSVSPRGRCSRSSHDRSRSRSQAFSACSGGVHDTDDDWYLNDEWANKENIHRDNSEISPYQVEEAVDSAVNASDSPVYGRIADVLAFPAGHETYGEVVGLILVPKAEALRVDIRTLHDALRASPLDQSKWPEVIVYMDQLPQQRGKPVRARLRERLNLPDINEETQYIAKHWEAKCPPPDTSIMVPIEVAQCRVDLESITCIIESVIPNYYRAHVEENQQGGYEVLLAPREPDAPAPGPGWVDHIRRLMHVALSMEGHMGFPGNLHVVSDPLPADDAGELNTDKLTELRVKLRKGSLPQPIRNIEDTVKYAFATALDRPAEDIPLKANFFDDLGGNTSQAEKLMASLRVDFNIHLPFSLLAKTATVEGISEFIESCIRDAQILETDVGCTVTYSSTRFWLLMLQLVPSLVLFPAQRSLELILQLYILSKTRFWSDTATLAGRIANLILSLVGAWAGVQLVFPFIGMLAKWTIIGRYKEGTYPMWGPYHTRWWIVQKIEMLCGMGFFAINDTTRSLYLRMMGAKIGKNVRLTDVALGEWDLIDIRDGAILTSCQCRPFAAEHNTSMYLGRIIIGERASIGLMSVVAPGTEVLPDTFMGANSSSWEQKDSREWNRDPNAPRINEPHWLLSIFLTLPIYFIGWTTSFLPWFFALFPTLTGTPQNSTIPFRVLVEWYQNSPQVAYNYLSVGSNVVFGPVFAFLFAASWRYLSKFIWGDLPTDPKDIKSNFSSWRATMAKTIFPAAQLFELNELLGHNNEARSGALRWLGARVGRRVCWPNTGPSIPDYHLLNIGDDVTFGENCFLMTTDENASGQITIGQGAVIADHVCILPGVTIGERTALGLGTLTRQGKVYEANKTFIGAKNGDVAHSDSFGEKLWAMPGSPVYENDPAIETIRASHGITKSEDEKSGHSEKQTPQPVSGDDRPKFKNTFQRRDSGDTLVNNATPAQLEEGLSPRSGGDGVHNPERRKFPSMSGGTPEDSPYNRAVYSGHAPYYVFGPVAAMAFSFAMTLFTAIYWNVPALSSVKVAARIFVLFYSQTNSTYDALIVYALCVASSVLLYASFVFMALGSVVAAKKILIGKYRPGVYDWDKSPYCQRWQLLLSYEKLIRRCFVDKGILSLLTSTHWLVIYYRALGVKIGKDCALFANGHPSLMITETDLIEIGDRVVIDDVGIISHVDRRGSMRLDHIKIGNCCVLRAGSNILCGAEMKDYSCLLEHTLVLPGEVVGEKWTMQRRPAERFFGSRKGSIPQRNNDEDGPGR
ncbi:hypothetical protein HIM_05758 [Hirsutella minnesotensis 3608]|uniref:Carrier domain-containing protein n=1 Tax=Hirsutella minnesotensis 3608 TaxID=1043627 RepID=A0A0F8A577_9HYPO|nr:hypothetical protein HIM_05758 [Hirsutella minnesotensis 3608]